VKGARTETRSRRFWIIGGLLGAVLIADLGVFAWLVFRSVSQREFDRVLDEAREEAQQLSLRLQRAAERTDGDLFAAVSLDQETQAYVDAVLRQRAIVQTVEINDARGVLVMRQRRGDDTAPGATAAEPDSPPSLDVTAPIGGYGSLRIGLSPVEMQRRIGGLRDEFLGRTFTLGGITVLIVAVTIVLVSNLIRRGERLERQATEAERLAYIGTLAAGLAHEIRNPLNSLNLNMQMLEEDLPRGGEGETGRRLLTVTRSEIGRLERLVSEFLRYARPRPLELEEVAAIDLLIAVREVMAGQIAQHGAAVRLVDESEEACVRVDAEQIRQLLLNLLHNALIATEGTGRPPDILLLARREGEEVELAVHDNGRGIPPAERDRIFEAFFSTRKGGTGLGLAIAERIARAHGGRLACDSDFGYGTRFVLSLPMVPGRQDEETGSA